MVSNSNNERDYFGVSETFHLHDGGPFFDLVVVSQALFVGTIPIFVKDQKIVVDDQACISWTRKTGSDFGQHINEIIFDAKQFCDQDAFSFKITCMLANLAYERVKEWNDDSLEFEFFRHVRNASAHANKFWFRGNEPKRPAFWRGIDIDSESKGRENPFQLCQCFGNILGSGDLPVLLWDIEQILPKECFCGQWK
jgi:hypothetical protein